MSSRLERSAWCRAYRVALLLLPMVLRRKHGDAMVALLARDLASTGDEWERFRITAAAMGDVFRRAPYEWGRSALAADEAAEPTAAPSTVTLRDVATQLIVPFGAAFVVSTGLMVALYVERSRFDVAPLEQFLLSLPYMCVLTVPLSLCVAVAWVGRRLRRDTSGHIMPRGLQRSVLVISASIAAFTLVLGSEIVPRTNARLVEIRFGQQAGYGDRTMTLGELSRGAKSLQARAQRNTTTASAHADRVKAAELQVEYHKKLVLAASCIVLAFVGLALGWYLAHTHAALAVLSSAAAFVLFVLSIMAGESLADSLAVSPAFAMWAGTELLAYAVLVNVAAQRSARRLRPAADY